MKVVCDSAIPFLKGALEPYCQVVYVHGSEICREMVMDADALVIRTRTRCNATLLEGTKVRFIATATIGYDHIDTQWCESHGIRWTNAPGCNSWSVQQYIGSLLVTMSRTLGFSFRERTLGIVGAGNVGSKVARLAVLLGFRVLLCDPPRARREGSGQFVSLDEIISRSDIITLHVPLIRDGEDATFHLFDDSRLASMNRNQILINSSRGEVVDGAALKNALAQKKILAASLDVWENEPQIDTQLLSLLFTGTPHIAGYSVDGKATGTTMSVQALGKFFDLPCRDWEVTKVPQSVQPSEFSIDTTGKTPQEVLADAILHTYDIRTDDAALRANTASFEKQRSNYPVRREFPAFCVRTLNDDTGRSTVFLREAGFYTED
ncbi:MAG: 4-phosphoerythronate dehydrogenase PdxB [Bacteroidaceae bacterium]|nr:4-phosphoerythronate dehydrogenase PdxB [Bacteroidaceae bacterium]MBR6857580.1 4-phosphoerythronate dehydrogenase PdxB [Bacteroidaceae bacterium]